MRFMVSGTIKLDKERIFEKEVAAATENAAKEKVYALFGSNNRLKREKIKITSVKKVSE
jgi:ribosomal protein L20A (L18A)